MYKKSLVIGINNYQHFTVLENSINDATDIHTFLEKTGFESTLLLDISQADCIQAIADFKNSISENTVSLIYFSGHGLQDEKYNFLVTIDSKIRIPEDIKYNCILADDLLLKASKTNLHLIILDACRDNPFYKGTRSSAMGLLKMDAPAGTLIAFATSPNSVSIERVGERNGIYTKSLLKNMAVPNLPVELTFKNTRNDVLKDTSEKQVPWEESSLSGDNFSFINVEVENNEKRIAKLIFQDKNVSLQQLIPFLNDYTFETESFETVMLLLTLMKILFSYEQEGIISKTMDEDYLTDELIDHYYPLFQDKLIKENNSSKIFSIDVLGRIVITKNINFGNNKLPDPDEYFPQMMVNYITYEGWEGILSFYLSVRDGMHFLKPVIILNDNNQINLISYAIVAGNNVEEIANIYFEMRKPFEKEIPKIESFSSFQTRDMSMEEIERLFKENDNAD